MANSAMQTFDSPGGLAIADLGGRVLLGDSDSKAFAQMDYSDREFVSAFRVEGS